MRQDQEVIMRTTDTPPQPTDTSLIDAARALGPIITEHRDAAERERRLARPVIDAMRDAGMFRMFTPRALGGLETDPVTLARVTEEIARFDSAAAWAFQAGNTGSWWAARMPAEGVAEVFADGPDLLMSASFAPPHRADAVPGGYRLTGRGPLASTIHDSPWVFMSGIVHEDGAPRMTPAGPAVVGLTMPASDVQIMDTWHSLGMRGTDSNDVATDGVFVPTSRSFVLMPQYEPAPQFRGPLYRLPATVATIAIVAPVALAIGRAAIDELRDLATKKVPMGSRKTLRDRTLVQSALARAEADLRAARLLFYDTLSAAWRHALAGEEFSLEQKADLMLAGTYAVQKAADVTDAMHRLAGTSGIYTRSRLERLLRDAHTVRHHGFHNESRYETVGQVYLGVEPEFPFVVF
jgi:alkylation response protein AidB-like acyl-CoA dehydrogenase